MKKRVLLWLVLGAMLSGTLLPVLAQTDRLTNWWNESVWYLLFVRSFYDSDGDGIGDLQGVIEKLDYLNDGDPNTTDDLGITAIWLLPIAENSAYHGYHTTDYRSVEADYGTNEDFLQLMDEAHARGIRIVVDLVGNHTGREHEWFQASAAGDPAFEDWYIWEDENPGYNGPWGARAWWPLNDRFYYGIFASDVPDLNHHNPDVTAEFYDIARFWIEEMGVDGFRLDAAKYFLEIELDGRNLLEDTPANRDYLRAFNDYVRELNPDAMVIAEIFDRTAVISRYTDEDVFDLVFEFDTASAMISASNLGNKRNIESQMNNVLNTYDPGEYALFTSNHDQSRVLTQLQEDILNNRIVANLLLTLPGAPFLYYGEEIGMVGAAQPDDINVRTPMQWDDTPQTGGFTTGVPWHPLTEGFAARTVAGQTDDPNSLLSHYRELIHLRNSQQALQTGQTIFLESTYKSAYSYLRYTEDEVLLVLHNMDDRESREYTLMLEGGPLLEVSSVQLIYSTEDLPDVEIPLPVMNEAGGFGEWTPIPDPLPPYSLYIFRLG